MSLKSDCLFLIKNAIEAINPQKLVKNSLKIVNGDLLLINNKHEFKLNNNVYLAAFGKAVNNMCIEVENILKDHFVKGIAILPVGSSTNFSNDSKIKVFYGAHNNLPDQAAFEAAKEVYNMCKSLDKNDLLIACVTGGGSALLPLPIDEICLEDKIDTIKLIASAGANINELNTIRGCLSKVKCGGLARCAYPAKVISLIISDVINDPLDIIASGPTYIADTSDLNKKIKNSLNIIQKYDLDNKLPVNVLKYLNDNLEKNDDFDYESIKKNVNNFLIGNNKLAIESIRDHAIELNFKPSIILTNGLDGEAKDAAKLFAYLAFILNNFNFYQQNQELFENNFKEDFKNQNQIDLFKKFLSNCLSHLVLDSKIISNKFCILSGGETTVKLSGSTKYSLGGRNQEMTLAFKKELMNIFLKFNKIDNKIKLGKFLFTSFGSDGIDGPTDAAGAIVTSENDFDFNDIDFINKFLNEHNSYNYFEIRNCLIKIGHTGTNVSDLQIFLVDNSL